MKQDIKMEVVFKIIDVSAKPNATTQQPEECVISRYEQVLNNVNSVAKKLGTYEKDYFKMDGTFSLPSINKVDFVERGFWSTAISDENCDCNIEMTVTLNKQVDSKGLTLYFDEITDNFATSIRVRAYREDLLLSDEIKTNNSSIFTYATGIPQYNRLVFNFLKTNLPFRRIRVSELEFGLLHIFIDSGIININVLEEVDVLGATLPSNDFDMTIDNTDNKFNILNPEGVYEFLQENQPVELTMLVLENDEYVPKPFGTYYLNSWNINEGGDTATFGGGDYLELAREVMYYEAGWYNGNLYDLAVTLMRKINCPIYEVDEYLKTITVNTLLPCEPCVTLLQKIAMFTPTILYVDRENIVRIKKLPEEVVGNVTFNDVFDVPKISATDWIKNTVIPICSWYQESEEKELFNEEQELVGDYELVVYYSEPTSNATITVTGATVLSQTKYTHCAILQLRCNGVVTIGVMGKPWVKLVKTQSFINPLKFERGTTLELEENEFVNSVSVAKTYADMLFFELNRKYSHETGWNFNPNYELGDMVTIQDQFDNGQAVRINKLDISYDGVVDAVVEFKGG